MKLNYPIRYAVRPMIEQVGWSIGLNELERREEPVAYIVSKCYVISWTKNYSAKGYEETIYSVVFPFKLDSFGEYIREEPSFNLIHGQCVNADLVEKVFMTREEAAREADKMNDSLLRKRIASLPYDDNFNEKVACIKEEHQEKLEQYKYLEELTEKKTSDLVVDSPFKEQKVVVVTDGKMKILDESLYEFIRICAGEKFYAFSVTTEEFELMKEAIADNNSYDTTKAENRLLLEGEENIVKINDYGSRLYEGCFYLQNNYMFYDNDLSKPNKSEEDSKVTKVYTLETYEDVINSYIPNFISTIVLVEAEKDILQKKIIKQKNTSVVD